MWRSSQTRLSTAWVLFFALTALVWPSTGSAQTTTSNVQGSVTDNGGALAGATVRATGEETGFTYDATTDAQGGYMLRGLRPGTYEISASLSNFKPRSKTVQVVVGQNASVDFRLSTDLTYSDTVQVTAPATRLIETKTSEIGTNVTQDQVRFLPQNQRNFLNFAALAPGVRVSTDEIRKQVTAGGLDATQINVFVDGVSYKNDVLDGGVVGQDSSRGSPFPQAAVQEFQVLTQNYKAEHEKASSAVITAATRSGTNTWTGDGFLFYQDKALVSLDKYSEARDLKKPTFDRWQPGISAGGPIVRDKVLVFGAYEQNRQNRDSQVFLGSTAFPPDLGLQRTEGTFPSRFREHLAFVKTTLQPKPGHVLDLSYSLRSESDVRDFGQQVSFESANNIANRVDSVLGRWQVPGRKYLNEMTFTYQRAAWNPRPTNADQVGIDFEGVMRVGGRDTTQDFVQERFSLRDDITRSGRWRGTHMMKAGAVVSFLNYDVSKQQFGNPLFRVRSSTGFAFPSEASYGVGNPDLNAINRQVGFYAQDDWALSSRWTLNAGLRWDYESDMLNNDYVTPPAVRTATAALVDPSRYFTDGTSRPPFYRAWQPRAGLSYDLLGDGRHVLFGGYGRYYDRVFYNAGLDERYRLQYAVRLFRFSATGGPDANGFDTIAWNPALLSKPGLDGLIARGAAPDPEIYLLGNDIRPPMSDQFNGGVRTTLHGIRFSASYAGIRARNGLTFVFANRRPDGSCCTPIPGFSNILVSSDAKKSWFDALYVTADRPYDGKWGATLAYTLGKSDAIGGDLFSLDYRSVEAYPRHPTQNDERNRIVASAIVGLPYDFMVSTLVTVSSGLGFTVADQSQGSAFDQTRVLLFTGRPEHNLAYRTVDLRLEKLFKAVGRHRASVAVEGFNIFNYTNDACFEGNIPTLPAVNPNFGKASCVVDNSTRRVQFGIRYTY
jgi:hypothetical protein